MKGERQNMTTSPLSQAFWVRDGMESSHLQEPAATVETQTPSYSPKELWSAQPREQSSCGEEHLQQEHHRSMWAIHQNKYQLLLPTALTTTMKCAR